MTQHVSKRSGQSLVHYRVAGWEIRSENAAKPMSQASQYLIDWLGANVNCAEALDYGCGKLRYAVHLVRCTRRLTCVDSEVQVSRIQRLGKRDTSVRAYVTQYWRSARVLSVEQFAEDGRRYNFILCANVLSAIPSTRIRADMLERLRSRLCSDGQVLLVTQYRNSYFDAVARSSRAIPHLDGWILRGRSPASYYGILDKDRLTRLATRHGFSIVQAWTHGQAAYVLAG